MNLRVLRTTAAVAGLTLALTACGQKPGVHVAGGQSTGQAGPMTLADGSGTTGGMDAGAAGGTAAATGTTGSTAAGGADPSTGGAAAGGGGGDAGAGATGGAAAPAGESSGNGGEGSQPAAAGGSRTPQGSDRTGASEQALTLGVHAPVTGAAPLPTTSFEKSGDLFWKYLTEVKGESVLGRTEVHVEFRDDKYSPDSARQVCRELSSKAFLLIGGGGTDQIQACGQLAQVAKFPYFSAGVTENGLAGNPWYFASSMTYKQQGALLATYVKKNPDGIASLNGKAAAIVTNTSNFDDAVAGWEAGVSQNGIDYYKTLRHPKGDTSWYASYAQQLKDAGVTVIYVNTSPVDYIRFAQVADEQFGYNPQYIGVGITKGLNAVLGSGCKDGDPEARVGGGIFFSPFFGLDTARQQVPEFFEAGQQLGKPTDDIALALWGIAAQQHELFKRYGQMFGNDLTREDFRALTEAQSSIETPVFPAVGYSANNHFGGKQVHVLRADCASGEYQTVRTFASSF